MEPGEEERLRRIGRWITRRREQMDWTQEELARRIGTNRDNVAGIENGRVRGPNLARLDAIAREFGIPHGAGGLLIEALGPGPGERDPIMAEAERLIGSLPEARREMWREAILQIARNAAEEGRGDGDDQGASG
jgi:transcriptional regulator with XRE-family HTH domain